VFSLPSLLRLDVAAAAAFDVLARLSFERRGRDPTVCNEQRLGSRAARFFLKACKNGRTTTDTYEMRKQKSCKTRVLELLEAHLFTCSLTREKGECSVKTTTTVRGKSCLRRLAEKKNFHQE